MELGRYVAQHPTLNQHLRLNLGIEVEMHRITAHGHPSQRPYPALLGDEQQNPFITNDFVECQTEMITRPFETTTAALQELRAENETLRGALNDHELLWPYSMPPCLPADLTQLKLAQVVPEAYHYRQRLAKKRGKTRIMMTGVHLNFSLPDTLLQQLNQAQPQLSAQAFRDHCYLKIAQRLMQQRWLMTYLFGACPGVATRYHLPVPATPVRSLRNSQFYGFSNDAQEDYTSVPAYVANIRQQVRQGVLLAPREYYGAVRLKGQDLLQQGVDYLEWRVFDLNPFVPLGIDHLTLDFVRLLVLHDLLQPALPADQVAMVLQQAKHQNNQVALERPDYPTAYQAEALAVFDQLVQLNQSWQLMTPQELQQLRQRVLNPHLTLSAQLLRHWHGQALAHFALQQAQQFQQTACLHPAYQSN
ncbi:hypothetical protein [Loigolactobacillus bifermentans]|uniref:Glutamate--cysteine ligase n=1 Tax=Loigolactobacillus bifermentans DSM 20003 TaxID=1423726 RepID=A0A0R1GEM1_9LACO|nr:hypothetical protein [Loigolactobacillus bifermentans]KRK32491.1 glutamate-cysteine ligase [Loigolactobacillus bifermentans DSM 20003]QGG60171.1 hypothetical protein LB003_06720 [Loigolactobacillus bifermentans]